MMTVMFSTEKATVISFCRHH